VSHNFIPASEHPDQSRTYPPTHHPLRWPRLDRIDSARTDQGFVGATGATRCADMAQKIEAEGSCGGAWSASYIPTAMIWILDPRWQYILYTHLLYRTQSTTY